MKNKIKTKRGAAKRFKITGTGKIMYMPTGHNHKLEKKSSSMKASKNQQREVPKSDFNNVRKQIPNIKL